MANDKAHVNVITTFSVEVFDGDDGPLIHTLHGGEDMDHIIKELPDGTKERIEYGSH